MPTCVNLRVAQETAHTNGAAIIPVSLIFDNDLVCRQLCHSIEISATRIRRLEALFPNRAHDRDFALTTCHVSGPERFRRGEQRQRAGNSSNLMNS